MSSSATSTEVAFDPRTACASLIACCATAVALSRIDCGSVGFELTIVSNERAVWRRATAEAKDISFGNDAYKSFPKLYHVFALLPIPTPRHPPRPCCNSRMPSLTAVAIIAVALLIAAALFIMHEIGRLVGEKTVAEKFPEEKKAAVTPARAP
jgi:hypothetical protein